MIQRYEGEITLRVRYFAHTCSINPFVRCRTYPLKHDNSHIVSILDCVNELLECYLLWLCFAVSRYSTLVIASFLPFGIAAQLKRSID